MAPLLLPHNAALVLSSSSSSFTRHDSSLLLRKCLPRLPPASASASAPVTVTVMCQSSDTKLVTFLGKGGSGKTFAALLAAQFYARKGFQTCLVLQSQEPTADLLLGKRLGNSPTSFVNGALDVVRLETTKLLLEPLAQVKKADSRLKFSQGALDEVVGEELSVLPGMDSFLALGAMERLIGFARDSRKTGKPNPKYDIVVYDASSTEELLRLLGSAEKARWYLQSCRNLAEKTETGRLTSPSLLRLAEMSANQDSSDGSNTGRSTAEIWDNGDRLLKRIADTFGDAKRFLSFLVTDPTNDFSLKAAVRYWGCAMQAGARVSGAFSRGHEGSSSFGGFEEQFHPLAVAELPSISMSDSVDWEKAVASMDDSAKNLLLKADLAGIPTPVQFDLKEQTVTFFLPGFEKSEIKLSQWRGGSALLLEVGDQRRVVNLPPGLQGRVSGAKLEANHLAVSMKSLVKKAR